VFVIDSPIHLSLIFEGKAGSFGITRQNKADWPGPNYKGLLCSKHTKRERERERANIHCQGIH
jgi:hypothetical protein